MFFLLQNDARFANTKSLFYNARELHAICKEDLTLNTPSTLEMIAARLTSDVDMLKEVLPDETIVVFFDGMDELPESIQKLIITTLTALSQKHSHLKIILGARPSASGIA